MGKFHALIQCLLLLMSFSPLLAAEYFVSNSGDDGNSGTSPSKPWRTIGKVNSFDFSPGDIIRFERGGVWREQLIPHSGSEEGYITYTAYGEGEKPLLLGSVERNDPKDWCKTGENIWSTHPFPCDVGNIIFNNGEVCGIKVWNEEDLDEQNEFWFDRKNKIVKIYSTKNPAEMYNDVECALTRHIINESGRSYVIYDGLHLAYGSAHGIGGGGTHHIIVRNCDVSFVGGGHQYSKRTKRGVRHIRYGNGIEFWGGAHDNIVENCRIWDIYDAGVTNQGGSKNSQYNIVYRNNIIWNCEYSFEYWNRPETSTTHDIYFEKNIVFNAGKGWSHSQRPWHAGVHMMFFNNTAKTYNFFVRNNIFHGAELAAIIIRAQQWNGLDKLVLSDNIYYQPAERAFAFWGDKSYSPADFEKYKQETGKDEGSKLVALRGIVVSPAELKLRIGASQQLKVIGQYSHGVQIDVTDFAEFSSSDEAIAAASSTGVVKGLKTGKATITVTFEGLKQSLPVTVTP